MNAKNNSYYIIYFYFSKLNLIKTFLPFLSHLQPLRYTPFALLQIHTAFFPPIGISK